MRKMLMLGALALLVPAAAGAGPAGAARPPAPAATPLPPGQAQALAAAPGVTTGGFQTRPVSPQEALAASALPGAVGGVAPGLSPQQAVGLAAAPVGAALTRPAAAASAATACSANSPWRTWGTWPYEQKLTETTYWCAVPGDHITYWTTSVTATGTLCGTSWTSSQLTSGGIGYSWFVLRSSAGWGCPTVVPWVTLHPSHYIDYARNVWGTTEYLGSN